MTVSILSAVINSSYHKKIKLLLHNWDSKEYAWNSADSLGLLITKCLINTEQLTSVTTYLRVLSNKEVESFRDEDLGYSI